MHECQGSLQLVGEMCKEKPDCKSARPAGKFPGEARYVQGQKDKRSWPEEEGAEECSGSQDQSEC